MSKDERPNYNTLTPPSIVHTLKRPTLLEDILCVPCLGCGRRPAAAVGDHWVPVYCANGCPLYAELFKELSTLPGFEGKSEKGQEDPQGMY